MRLIRFLCCVLVALFCLGMVSPAMAAEVDCDAAYCFTAADFGREELTGICITGLPDSEADRKSVV